MLEFDVGSSSSEDDGCEGALLFEFEPEDEEGDEEWELKVRPLLFVV